MATSNAHLPRSSERPNLESEAFLALVLACCSFPMTQITFGGMLWSYQVRYTGRLHEDALSAGWLGNKLKEHRIGIQAQPFSGHNSRNCASMPWRKQGEILLRCASHVLQMSHQPFAAIPYAALASLSLSKLVQILISSIETPDNSAVGPQLVGPGAPRMDLERQKEGKGGRRGPRKGWGNASSSIYGQQPH